MDERFEKTVEPITSWRRGHGNYGDINAIDWVGKSRRIMHKYNDTIHTFRVPDDPELNLDSIYGDWRVPVPGSKGRKYYKEELGIHPARQPFRHSPYYNNHTEFELTECIGVPGVIHTDGEIGLTRKYHEWETVTPYVQHGPYEIAIAKYPTGTYTFVCRKGVCGPIFYSKVAIDNMDINGDVRVYAGGKVYSCPDVLNVITYLNQAPIESPYPLGTFQ